jgi:cardiolipin-specific phospholipase
LYGIVHYSWRNDITPQRIMRALPNWLSTRFTNGYTSRRFSYLDEDLNSSFSSYIHAISVGKGSGEFSASSLLVPGAYARFPITERLQKLQMPVSFIYGSNDWMNHKHAVVARDEMKEGTKILVVHEAGHHLYADKPDVFNHALATQVDGSGDVGMKGLEYV